MNHLLDTNICISIIRKKPRIVLQRLSAATVGSVGISAITVAELAYGVQKSQSIEQNQQALEQFLLPLLIVDFDFQAALTYGSIRAELERNGKPIGAIDTIIGAHALSLGVTLVTNNTKEFQRIPDLLLEDWSIEP
jgi:tRNA(fMet)-specific endonuclease VapC